MSDAKIKELVTELLAEELNKLETIVTASNVNVEQCEKKIATLMEFLPVEELKYQDINNGEEYITKIAKTACKGIFDETRETVNDHTQEQLNEMESTIMTRI